MNFPDFFNLAPRLRVHDPLAALLGAPADGLLEYGYADAVRLAGHSCPTVASAYLLGRRVLLALFPEGVPQRGSVRLALRESGEAGVVGVQAAVLGMLTGAAAEGGFKGLGGQYARRDLLRFGVGGEALLLAQRTDNGVTLAASLNLGIVPGDPAIMPLLQACLSGQATAAERQEFGERWQARVRCLLLDHADDPALIHLEPAVWR